MTQQADKLDTPIPGPDLPVEKRRNTAAPRSRWHRQAMIIFAAAAIAYVVYKLPPYLTFDSSNSPIPPEHGLHFAFLIGHVTCGSTALLTAVLQLWPWLRRKHPKAHRISGRIYIFVGALPSAALALAMYPVTHGPGRVSVLVAATLWSTMAIFGWMAARQKRYAAHRRWMVYSFAVMWGYGVWVFVIANALYYGADLSVETSMESARWLGWIGNLLIAHWWLERTAGRTIIGVPRRSAKLKVTAGAGSPAS